MGKTDAASSARSDHRVVLLVEDNPGDVRLTQEALDGEDGIEVEVASSGKDALAYLNREPPHEDAPRPDLVLLDLNLPGVDGREVLEKIKTDPDLRAIPVIVLTTSSADRDVEEVYAQHANAFVSKPLELDRFLEVMSILQSFWFDVAELAD